MIAVIAYPSDALRSTRGKIRSVYPGIEGRYPDV